MQQFFYKEIKLLLFLATKYCGEVGLPNWIFWRALLCGRRIMSCSSDAFLLKCSFLCSIESASIGFVRFEKLITHDTNLIRSNTEHSFFPWIFGLISSSLDYLSGLIVIIRCIKAFHLFWSSNFLAFKSVSMILNDMKLFAVTL